MTSKSTSVPRKTPTKGAPAASDADIVRKMLADDPETFLQTLTRRKPVYENVLKVLWNPEAEVQLVTELLLRLEHHVSLLDADHKTLTAALVNLRWLDRGPELVSVYQAFMLNLVSAHASNLKPCLRMLVKNFTPDATKSASLGDPAVKSSEDSKFSHVHSLLRALSQMVPLTSVLLPQILADLFPYVNKGVAVFESYTRSLLTITTYLPALRHSILELLIKHMLKLDVRSCRLDISSAIFSGDDKDEEEDMEDVLEGETLFKMEDTEDDKAAASVEKPEDRLAASLPQAGSLDNMMNLTFEYIRKTCYTKDKLDWETTKQLYKELLSVFEKFTFPTHESCHVQFLMFFVCSFKEALSDGFIDYLWKRVTDPTAQCVYRQTAACYIGSFIARANFLSIYTSKQILELVMKWIHSYVDQMSDHGLSADVNHHGPFYAVCQTAFYIFCFKHNDFIQTKKDHKWAESLNFQRVVTSKLNPLRVCPPIIVKTFASASRMHQLAFCDTIIERNNRYTIPVASMSTTCDEQILQAYFPFDPYLLPRSGCYIIPLYKEFHGALPSVGEIESEEEDDFLPDEEEEEDFSQSKHAENLAMSLGKSPVDLMHYGVSPGFKHA